MAHDERQIRFHRHAATRPATVEPSLAGPKRPQDRVRADERRKPSFDDGLATLVGDSPRATPSACRSRARTTTSRHGDVVIAAITCCTNTSNPGVLLAAGLLAQKAAERVSRASHGSRPRWRRARRSSPTIWTRPACSADLEELGFDLVGYGCTTCIGNSGPLPDAIAEAIKDGNLVVAAVLSGNRNFEGRVHPEVKANYLASPPLVVAYALAGSMLTDITTSRSAWARTASRSS